MDPEVDEIKRRSNNLSDEPGKKSLVRRIFRSLLDWLIALLIAIIFVFILTQFVVQGKVSGESMTDTYQDGQRVFINKHPLNYEVGDVITFWADKGQTSEDDTTNNSIIQNILYETNGHENQELHIKRIVAVPGDKVQVKDNDVYVNGEKRVDAKPPGVGVASFEDAEYTIEDGEYFVVGDNYDNSLDSRYHGPVNEDDILGKVINSKEREPRPEQKGTNIQYVDEARAEA